MEEAKNRLDQKKRFLLTKFIVERFADAKLEDEKFAELAERELGFAPITRSNVSNIRREFDIDPYRMNTGGGMAKQIEELRLRIETIEESLEVLHRERRENHIRDSKR